MSERLFKAYFVQNLPLADKGVLIAIAAEIGLDTVETHTMLASNAFAEDVQADENSAREIGIRSVPHMVINGQHYFAGAQSKNHLLTAIRSIWAQLEACDQASLPGRVTSEIDGCSTY